MKVFVSGALRGFFGHSGSVEAAGTTLGELLASMTDEYPGSRKALFDDNGRLRAYIRVFVNGEDHTPETYRPAPLPEGAEILLLPLIAGGAPEEPLVSDERRKGVTLDNSDIERFNCHLLLREVGVKGQKRIRAAKVAVIGAGALGSAVIQYLAAAGVGTLKVADPDQVTLSNLQDQVLYGLRDVKRPKAASVRDRVRGVDRGIQITAENIRIDETNVQEFIVGSDLVVDCTDNYVSRYVISDACVLSGIPLVFGSMHHYEGLVTVLGHRGGPCLRCLFPSLPPPGLVPTCAEGGVLAPLPGIIGSIQAGEVLKLLTGLGEPLNGRLLSLDMLSWRQSVLRIRRNVGCPVCGDSPTITDVEAFDYRDFCGLNEADDQIPVEALEPDEFARRLEQGPALTVVDVREPHERAILRFPGAVIIPIGQLARRQKELDPARDTVFICREGKRSILAVNTLREAGYTGPMYSLKGGLNAMKDTIFSHEGGWL